MYKDAGARRGVLQHRFEPQAYPNVFLKFRSKFEEWLTNVDRLASMAIDMKHLEDAYRCACVRTKPSSSEEGPSPSVGWSMAWYVAGGPAQSKSIVDCMDSTIAWRQRDELAGVPQKLRARMSKHTSLQLVLGESAVEVETTVESVCCPGKRRVDVAPPTWKHGCEGSCFTSDVSTKRLARRTQRALMPMEDGGVELTKMGVLASARGRGRRYGGPAGPI